MRSRTLKRLTRYMIAGMVIATLLLVAGGCRGGSTRLGEWGWGDVLRARVVSIERTSQVAFQDDYSQWVESGVLKARIVSIDRVPEIVFKMGDRYQAVRPKGAGNELVLFDMDLFNRGTDAVSLSLDSESVELVAAGDGQQFRPVDPYVASVIVESPSEDEVWPIKFLWGDVELGKELYLSGSVIFEVPKGTSFKRLDWREGDTITIDFKHLVVRPKEDGNELVLVQMDVVNYGATTKVFLSIDSKGIELGDKKGYQDFYAVDPFAQGVKVEVPPDDEGKYVPFLWGPVELEKDFQISGWVIFEVPKGTQFRRAVWREGDSVYIDF